jgi:hypothetical protein
MEAAVFFEKVKGRTWFWIPDINGTSTDRVRLLTGYVCWQGTSAERVVCWQCTSTDRARLLTEYIYWQGKSTDSVRLLTE